MHHAAASTGPSAAAASLLLQLCTDSSGLPLTFQHITTLNPTATAAAAGASSPSPGFGPAGFTTPSKTPNSNSRTAAPASSSKKSAKKSSASKAGQQQQQQGDSSSSSGAKQGDVAAQWQLRLLQAGVDWSNIKHRQLLQQLAHRQLLGRALLPGVRFSLRLCCYSPILNTSLLAAWIVGVPVGDHLQPQCSRLLCSPS